RGAADVPFRPGHSGKHVWVRRGRQPPQLRAGRSGSGLVSWGRSLDAGWADRRDPFFAAPLPAARADRGALAGAAYSHGLGWHGDHTVGVMVSTVCPRSKGVEMTGAPTEITFLGTSSVVPGGGHDTASFLINGRYLVDTGWYATIKMRVYGFD